MQLFFSGLAPPPSLRPHLDDSAVGLREVIFGQPCPAQHTELALDQRPTIEDTTTHRALVSQALEEKYSRFNLHTI